MPFLRLRAYIVLARHMLSPKHLTYHQAFGRQQVHRMSEDKYHESIESIYRKSVRAFSNCYIEIQRKLVGRDAFDADDNNRLKVADDFKIQIFRPLGAQKNIDPNQVRDELRNLDKVNDPVSLIRVGCAFAITAYRAHKVGDEHKAWVCMGRSQLYLGRAYGARFMPLSVGRAVKKSASKHGQRGASAKHAPEHEVKEFAIKLAQRHLGDFQGANGAAIELAPQINAYLRKRERLAEEGDPFYDKKKERRDFSPSTIRRWFKGLTFTG